MRHQHGRRRARRLSSSSSAILFAAACVFGIDLTLARRDDDSWDPSTVGRRARVAGSIRGANRNKKVKLLVKYKNGFSRTRSLSSDGNVTAYRLFPSSRWKDSWHSHTTSTSTISEEIESVEIDASDLDLVLEEMKADEYVEHVEEDFLMFKLPYVSIERDDDNRYLTQQEQQNRTLLERQQYGLELIQAPAVWKETKSKPNKYRNAPVKVCIVDTGYDFNHEDLPHSGVTMTETGYGNPLLDVDGHGTHCAGVIGAVGNNGRGIVGVNPDPRKFSFHISKALNDDGMGTATSVLVGIRGCIDSGAKIMSLSLGGGEYSPIFAEIYKEAYNAGVLVFAAAGNLGLPQEDHPASYPHVVSVGAVNELGRRADFSNWSNQLELMAPGQGITSCFPGGYGTLSGTSMATPFAAAAAALVWGYFPECSNNQIRNVLAMTARKITTDGSRCNRKTGFGLVNAKSAFDILDKYGCSAGGANPTLLSDGGKGGCNQPIADISQLESLQEASSSATTGSSSGCKKLVLQLVTDPYGYETYWKIRRKSDGKVIKSGPPPGSKYAPNTEYSGPLTGCLSPGKYVSIIFGK